MLRLLIASITLLAGFQVYAESGAELSGSTLSGSIESTVPLCNQIYTIHGPSVVKIGSSHEYSVEGVGGADYTGSVVYTIRRDNKIVETIRDKPQYLRNFSALWTVKLEARLTPTATPLCDGNLSLNIQVYKSAFTYIGTPHAGIVPVFEDTFEKNHIISSSYESLTTPLAQTDGTKSLWNTLDKTDILLVASPDVLGVFSDMLKLQKTNPINFSRKKIYILSDYPRSFISKVLASTLSQLGANKISLISEDQLYTLATRVATDSDVGTIGEEFSYEKSRTIYSLWGFLDFLAYAGFSYQLLAVLLSLTFVVLVLNIFKQVIGLDVFGIYYPILFAIMMVALGFSGAFVFIVTGVISILLVNLFTKKIHLLLHAKRALLVSLYIFLLLFALGIDNYFDIAFVRYAVFDNSLIIFPIFIAIVVADKIFQDEINLFSRLGLYDLLQYLWVTLVIYLLIQYKPLQYFLISYPDVILLFVILNILVGRYMWLQLVEYFRFAPLLRKLDEEE